MYTRESILLVNECKLGITQNLYERDKYYITGELYKGTFTHIYKIDLKHLYYAELLL